MKLENDHFIHCEAVFQGFERLTKEDSEIENESKTGYSKTRFLICYPSRVTGSLKFTLETSFVKLNSVKRYSVDSKLTGTLLQHYFSPFTTLLWCEIGCI
ncbi:hypothetical protein Gasu_29720 isoform 2 [Galdieria sulphuraria]|uniref:Uncharacterized protein n=1 Tax=Galdieria sulphuraria TaxID=130081 RepID=M2X0A0_GALSU|nr:hypothetical protein Gasu_29720 isoform 1 [Galdieria sulphuraria]XP_005706276.1 hypothetical protein Gasu_29720 isoform 2 [Galdieria sulphuraria]EME29755.1 hypothetical protein isoform 1 [Galdieria sulphuraria]EME29756.1 hypothetical protein isoform 2 [Galdieria sulphuraria]|eukprot:XP_005706275.1 hypothetical protein isoform 1 [Galdieria sulphuraria]